MQFTLTSLFALAATASAFPALVSRQASNSTGSEIMTCGNSTYTSENYNCFNGSLLCPILNGSQTLPCGESSNYDCYLVSKYICVNQTIEPVPSTITIPDLPANGTGIGHVSHTTTTSSTASGMANLR